MQCVSVNAQPSGRFNLHVIAVHHHLRYQFFFNTADDLGMEVIFAFCRPGNTGMNNRLNQRIDISGNQSRTLWCFTAKDYIGEMFRVELIPLAMITARSM